MQRPRQPVYGLCNIMYSCIEMSALSHCIAYQTSTLLKNRLIQSILVPGNLQSREDQEQQLQGTHARCQQNLRLIVLSISLDACKGRSRKSSCQDIALHDVNPCLYKVDISNPKVYTHVRHHLCSSCTNTGLTQLHQVVHATSSCTRYIKEIVLRRTSTQDLQLI